MRKATLNTFLQLFLGRRLFSRLLQQIALKKHYRLQGKGWQQRVSNSAVQGKVAASDKIRQFNTTVRPVSTVFLTVRMTIAAALASSPDVGSSMKMIEGLATNSTAMVSLFLCSVERPSTPGSPTIAFLNGLSSTKSITSSTNIYSM
ncbi:hypothetical protein RJ640_009651 [Escallonia rubra]|uniref:Uncharacterized protein n=1 Tax=Escallonia rubra TaxID=112253 RepID=A0AA88S919_9ASTE|nr:hypothetical protein RJ640_009648 [Escallonia rubra]KAK2994424.1 hypothetical protein RJ640_009651 [Escallonia rubra]